MVLLCALEVGFYLIFGLWVVIVVVWHADLDGFRRIFLMIGLWFYYVFGKLVFFVVCNVCNLYYGMGRG
jgi:hypothetical protein